MIAEEKNVVSKVGNLMIANEKENIFRKVGKFIYYQLKSNVSMSEWCLMCHQVENVWYKYFSFIVVVCRLSHVADLRHVKDLQNYVEDEF
jgi:hypothetical protein